MRKIKLGYVGEVKNYNGNNEKLLGLFDVDEYTVEEDVDLTKSHERVHVGRLIFLIFSEGRVKKLYRLLPLVEDDNVFKWKEIEIPANRNFTQQLNAQVICGMLQFGVSYYTTNGDVMIHVSIKGYRGGKQPFDTIRLADGDYGNKEILAAIEEYINNFKSDAAYIKIKGIA